MENIREKERLNEVANLQAIFEEVFGLSNAGAISNFKKETKQAIDESNFVKIERPVVYKAMGEKQNASNSWYKIVFRDKESTPLTISESMYDSLIANMAGVCQKDKPMPFDALIHGSDGDERISVRQSEILAIVKI